MKRVRKPRPTARLVVDGEPVAKKAKANEKTKSKEDSTLFATHETLHRVSNGRLGHETTHHRSKKPLAPAPAEESTQGEADIEGSGHSVEVSTGVEGVEAEMEIPKPRIHPITTWLRHRSTFADELLRHDGRPDHAHDAPCHSCRKAVGILRCKDCFGSHLHCSECLVSSHAQLPLHRIEKWTGAFFERTTLNQLNLRVQLGHHGGPCTVPERTQRPLTIVDTTGIHRVSVDYCGCGESGGGFHHRIQLLRHRWFPATLDRPSTIMTFDALEMFHNLTLQSKTTFYDFYHTLVRRTDNTGITSLPSCYKACMRIVREWRHLKMLKRSGRAHAAEGIDATGAGECAVECPACPQPGRNLPEGWQDAGEEDSWLYTLMLSIDANFRLKLKDRGFKDPELGSGWAYFVETDPYMAHLETCKDQEEINTCDSNLHAVDHANTRFSKGYMTTGVGCVVCTRHTLVRKNGVGDLQRGERYATMDYIVLSTLIGVFFTTLLFTYDIACQWSKNLFSRMADFPPIMQLHNSISKVFHAIPKFHLPAHGPKCHSKYSLNYRHGVGRSDGEGVERGWAHINAVATSTREMGPGSRHGTLDDHWGAWNWGKVIALGKALHLKLQDALTNQAKHRAHFEEFKATFEQELTTKWDAMIAAWSIDSRKPDPYSEKDNSTTLADVRLELAKEDTIRIQEGQLGRHNVTPSAFLYMGLELEEQQRVIQLRVAAGHAGTVTQKADIQERRNALKRRIENWRSIQRLYMPGVAEVHSNPDDDDVDEPATGDGGERAEEIDLCLPSDVPRMRNVGCLTGLHDMELRLRLAQAAGALNQLRRHLRIYSGLVNYKHIQVSGPGQRANTRARSLLTRFREKTEKCAVRYRAARSALVALDPGGSWTQQFQVLNKEDVRGPGREDDSSARPVGRRAYGVGTGEGHVEFSWIWKVNRGKKLAGEGVDAYSEDDEFDARFDEGLRVEYAKAKARIERWDEEVRLVTEEMRRTVAFLCFKSNWWLDRRESRSDAPEHIAAGLRAYACKQSHLMNLLAHSFCQQWLKLLSSNGLNSQWAADFLYNIQFEGEDGEEVQGEEGEDNE